MQQLEVLLPKQMWTDQMLHTRCVYRSEKPSVNRHQEFIAPIPSRVDVLLILHIYIYPNQVLSTVYIIREPPSGW